MRALSTQDSETKCLIFFHFLDLVYLLATIRPNIRDILGISLLPLFYPYGRYLALLYIYQLDPTLAYISHSHPSAFIAQEIITGGGQRYG